MTLMTSVNKKWKLVPVEDIFLDGNILIFFHAKFLFFLFGDYLNKYIGTALSEIRSSILVHGNHVPSQPKFVSKNALARLH